MTLVHDDKVEILCRYLPEMFLIILSDHLMIEGKVYFMGCDLAQTLLVGKVHFINGLFKRCKILQNALVNKNVPVSQIQNSLFKVRAEQPIHYLECSIRFASSRCHHKQQSLLPSGDCFHGSVYSVSLIIAWRICALRRVVRLGDYFLFQVGYALAAVQFSVISCYKLILCWKLL